MNRQDQIISVVIFFFLLLASAITLASSSVGTIDPNYKYAWGDITGWVNFGCNNCNVQITDTQLTGYFWTENYGWVNLNPTNGGVINDGEGNLSGYAWGENLGWINFDGVTIDSNGRFHGNATTTIAGTITFDCNNCDVRTDWRPVSVRSTTSQGGAGGIICSDEPTPPENGFGILINNGDLYTDSPYVTLTLNGGPDAIKMNISNNQNFDPEFSSGKIQYQNSYTWYLCRGYNNCPEGEYSVYVKFFNSCDRASSVAVDTINYKKPELITEKEIPSEGITPGTYQTTTSGIPGITETTPQIPEGESLITPTEEQKIITKEKEEISKPPIQQKQAAIEKELPSQGLTEVLNLPFSIIQPCSLPRAISLSQISSKDKENIPKNIIFLKTADGYLDIEPSMIWKTKNQISEQFTLFAEQKLQIILKPSNPLQEISSYLVQSGSDFKQTINLSDQDNDGIYTAEIVLPNKEDEYELITNLSFQNQNLENQRIEVLLSVKSPGYVYQKRAEQTNPIENAEVSLLCFDPKTKKYQLWPAKAFQQINPQKTSQNGQYLFLVPKGIYRLKVKAPGYYSYQTDSITVQKTEAINLKIFLTPKAKLLSIFDTGKKVILVIILLFLIYLIYRFGKKRLKNP